MIIFERIIFAVLAVLQIFGLIYASKIISLFEKKEEVQVIDSDNPIDNSPDFLVIFLCRIVIMVLLVVFSCLFFRTFT